MDINISEMMSGYRFENKSSMGNTAKKILKKQGASEKTARDISDITIFNSSSPKKDYMSAQLSMLKAASKISHDTELSETLKYLKTHTKTETIKRPKFGELWNSLSDKDTDYGEKFDFIEIDFSKKNIFEAA